MAICQQGSITAAASRLFLTKAAVSMALSELEKQLGQKLFDRINNRLHLNEQGKRLLPLADELLQRAQGIDHLFEQDSEWHGTLRLGASETLGNQLCPWLIAGFHRDRQHRLESLVIANTATIGDKLLEYELDIGLIEGVINHPQLLTLPWIVDEMCLICSPEHPLARLPRVVLADLEQRHWLVREQGSGSREFFMNQLAPELNNWRLAYELNANEALLNSVAAGLGIACVSALAARHAASDGRIVILPSDLPLVRRCQIVMHREKYQSPLFSEFIHYCQAWRMP